MWRNSHDENVLEHCSEVAIIAHTLVIIQNIRYNGNLDANRAATLAVFHETGETITGDIVTPIKYNNSELTEQFKKLEILATNRMCEQLPDDLRSVYDSIIQEQTQYPEWPFVKAADRITAYIKCIEEVNHGNREFLKAKKTINVSIKELGIQAVNDFMLEFIPSFSLSLDELL